MARRAAARDPVRGSVRRRHDAPRWTVAAALGILAVSAGVAVTAPLSSSPQHDPAMAEPADRARIRFPAGHPATLTLPDGEVRKVGSLLNVAGPMQFGDYVWNEDGVPAGPVWIRIDLARQTLSIFRAGHEIGSTVILYGTDGKATPTGVFPILERAASHRSSLYDAEMPFMLRLTDDGVAIHASNVRQGSATHGCIGIPLPFARLLFGQARRGDLVAILPATVRG